MVPVSIDSQLAETVPQAALGLLSARVRVRQHDPDLWREIEARIARLAEDLEVPDVARQAPIAALRAAYRALGKDPTRYRGSQEALLRRVLRDRGLYAINTLVDANNLFSLETFYSAGTFDRAKLEPPIVYRVGRDGEGYRGIGRDALNIAGLPVLVDAQGPFGSPTSDSERTKVTLETERILMFIVSFEGARQLPAHCARAVEILRRHGDADEVETAVVATSR